MATFRFNFFEPTRVEDESEDHDSTNATTTCYKEHYPDMSKLYTVTSQMKTQSVILSNDQTMQYLQLDDITESDHSLSHLILSTNQTHSDLLPGVYEGGLKVWECTYDLLEHMLDIDFKGKRVLDLGCGAGLLGIYALLKEAKEVHFQDFNNEVIQFYTIPNVILNIQKMDTQLEEEIFNKCRFFSGDWNEFRLQHKQQMKYDVIVTSETIYNPQCHSKLLCVLYELVDDIHGTVLVGAKVHYFGVGGTVGMFLSQIRTDNVFHHVIVKDIDSCVPRTILELKMN